VVPSRIEALVGVTAIETGAAGETVSVVCPETVPEAAVMVAGPVACEMPNPVDETVATADADELQTTVEVRFCVLPSEYVPVAANCCVVPKGIVLFAGVTAIDSRARGVTARAVPPLTVPLTALIVVLPDASPLASPPAVIVATVVEEEAHVTVVVRSFVVPSL
jgi:hypothetical protein